MMSGWPPGPCNRTGDELGGVVTACVWFNFVPDTVHWARYAGHNFTHRQGITRKAVRRYSALSPGERLAVLAVFFMQTPSFLAHQRVQAKQDGRSNTHTLFGLKQIPCGNHIRQTLDGMAPEHFDELWKTARKNAGTRMRFLEILRTRVIYQIFPSWRVFINLIANGREPPQTFSSGPSRQSVAGYAKMRIAGYRHRYLHNLFHADMFMSKSRYEETRRRTVSLS